MPSPRRSSRSTPSSSRGTGSRTRRTSRSSTTSISMASTPGEDINWLEDIALLEEDGVPAVFDRYSNSFLKIYFPIPAGPRGRDRAQGADEAPDERGLLRHPAQGDPLQVPAARARPVGRGLADRRHGLARRPSSRAGRNPPATEVETSRYAFAAAHAAGRRALDHEEARRKAGFAG